MTDPRHVVSIRMTRPGIEQVDAVGTGVQPPPTRSTIIRALLAEALASPAVRAAARRRLKGEAL